MKVYVAVNRNVAVAHYFDSQEAMDRLALFDKSAWAPSGTFTVEGTVHNLIVKDKKWVEEFYGF